MTENNQLNGTSSSLFAVGEDCWKHNKAIHLSSKGAARPWICRDANAPLLVFLPDQRQARDFVADSEELELFKAAEMLPEVSFSEDEAQINALNVLRGDILERFKNNITTVLVSTPSSVMAPFAIGGEFYSLECGLATGRSNLLGWLEHKGYVRDDLVWSPGKYAIRGSVVDVFSPADSFPVRIEFFDDEIESIRFFMPETQKSLRTLRKCTIQSLAKRCEAEFETFLPENLHVVYFDPNGLDNAAENSSWLWDNIASDKAEEVPWKKWEDICKCLASYPRVRIVNDVYKSTIRLAIGQVPSFRNKFNDLKIYCANHQKDGFSIRVFSEAENSIKWAKENAYVADKNMLSGGFIDSQTKMVLLTDLELSGMTIPNRITEYHAPSDWGASLQVGQWVVHEDYGTALYTGTQSLETSEGEQEYLVLQFADEQKLLVPVMQFYKISSWSPAPGQDPVADSLRNSHWKKSAEKARELAEKSARELAQIYAEREVTQGYRFEEHPDLMKSLEDGFIYTETADQISAINDVINDMQSPVPMDRLIVGDVGFGKTEVALRASGEAVFCGKQVAVLAPTTLLAQQHFETFTSRFSSLPVRVEVLSRFVPVTEQKKILNDLQAGKVDIIIGTHRLLSEDVQFKDLGLVVVDEEHRFGVMHKEQLKKLTPGVDVMMLSATPIPRSLSLSLSGLRDLSVLEIPPQRRLPIITIVRPWSEELLKNAVLREKNRGGQVFFVHNRISDIHDRAVMLKRLFPKLKIAVAHSRTSEATLEKTMLAFSAGEIDILICTTIVESGLDIPMANTLIVDDAQELGLAQMYQLRGRVGRREEQAYAFFFYPQDAHLSRESSERLEAIAQLDELGAGYRLAQRDLQIRGSGDVIGIAQHGHAGKVGYQKYCDMLAEEIAKIKGVEKKHVDIQINFPAIIPSDYLPQESLRITLYRRLLQTDTLDKLTELKDETIDRFGKLPSSVEFLFALSEVRVTAPEVGINSIVCSRDETVICGDPDGKWTDMKFRSVWIRRINGFIGPGGQRGIFELIVALKEAIFAKSDKITAKRGDDGIA
jgi:transcription-repair coupling factor (superfamily II helicase)